MTTPPPIDEAPRAHLGPVVDILAEAFADDPIFRWISTHPDHPRAVFDTMTPLFSDGGRIRIDATSSGAALWTPPGREMGSPLSLTGILRSLLRFGPRANLRGIRAATTMQRHHPAAPDHWYLFAIGTRRGARGTGLGSALMRDVLRQADADGVPAYLENSSEANLAFYRRHGFEVRGEIRLASDSPPMWPMWREPAGPASPGKGAAGADGVERAG